MTTTTVLKHTCGSHAEITHYEDGIAVATITIQTLNDAAERIATSYAANPDLYAALTQLRNLRDQWRNDDRYSSLDYMDAIDALPWESALAKARGEVAK